MYKKLKGVSKRDNGITINDIGTTFCCVADVSLMEQITNLSQRFDEQ